MDTPFTRRNSVDETYNYEDEFINISNTYMRLLYSITDNYSTNLQTYQTLMERCLTMGFQTQMNLFRLIHLNRRTANSVPQQRHVPIIPQSPSTNTTNTQNTTNTETDAVSNITPINTAPITTIPVNTAPITTIPVNTTPIRNTIRRNAPFIRRQNSISRRRYTEDTPIIPNPFYSHLFLPFEDVVVRPTNIEIDTASTILIYNSNNWNYEQHTCPISLEQFEENMEIRRLNVCGHIFKKTNIDRWFERNVRCPVCRFDIREVQTDTELNSISEIPEPEPEPNSISEIPEPEPEPDSDLDIDQIADSILSQENDLSTISNQSNIIYNEDTLPDPEFASQSSHLLPLSSTSLFNILNNELENFSQQNQTQLGTDNNPLSVLMNLNISRLDLSNNPI